MKSNLNTIIREKGNIYFSVFFYEPDIFENKDEKRKRNKYGKNERVLLKWV